MPEEACLDYGEYSRASTKSRQGAKWLPRIPRQPPLDDEEEEARNAESGGNSMPQPKKNSMGTTGLRGVPVKVIHTHILFIYTLSLFPVKNLAQKTPNPAHVKTPMGHSTNGVYLYTNITPSCPATSEDPSTCKGKGDVTEHHRNLQGSIPLTVGSSSPRGKEEEGPFNAIREHKKRGGD